MCERYINWLPVTQPQPGTWPATQACALIGNQNINFLVHRPALNPLSHTSQGCFIILKLKRIYYLVKVPFEFNDILNYSVLFGKLRIKKLLKIFVLF